MILFLLMVIALLAAVVVGLEILFNLAKLAWLLGRLAVNLLRLARLGLS